MLFLVFIFKKCQNRAPASEVQIFIGKLGNDYLGIKDGSILLLEKSVLESLFNQLTSGLLVLLQKGSLSL